MSQSRFSIVLVGVSALLRRPLVSRLRPADGERSSWVVFAARVGRFDSGFRWAGWPSGSLLPLFGMRRFGLPSAGWPSGSLLPLFGMRRFGVAAGRVRSSAFRFGLPSAGWPSGSLLPFFGTHRFGVAVRRVGLRAHRFRFSACTASEWLLGEFVLPPSASELRFGGLAFGLIASAFRPAPLRRLPSAGCFFRLPLRRLPLGGLAFGFTASAFRHAPLRRLPSAGWPSGSPLPLFGPHRFGVALGGLASGSLLPLFGMPRFGNCPRRVGSSAGRVGLRAHCFRFSVRTASEWPLGELAFGLTTSAFRHALLRSGRWASWFFRLPLRSCRSAGWPSGSLLPLFGTHRFGVAAGRVRSSAFRFGDSAGRVGLRVHCFHFSACTDSEWPLGELVLPPSASEWPSAGWFFRPAGWPSGSPLLLFGTHRSAPPHRRSEDRRSTPTRHLFHFKTLIPTC